MSFLYERLQHVPMLTEMPEQARVQSVSVGNVNEKGLIPLYISFYTGKAIRGATLYLSRDGKILRGGVDALGGSLAESILQTLEERLQKGELRLGEQIPVLDIGRPAFIPEKMMVHAKPAQELTEQKEHNRDIDPGRLELLREKGILRLEFSNERGSLAGYTCVVYPHGILLEHPGGENAAFELHVENLLKNAGIDPTCEHLSEEQAQRLKDYITRIVLPVGTTRRSIVETLGGERYCHIGDWQARIKGAVERLMGVSK